MNNIYFHGSPKDNLQIILNQGLKADNGRAVFSINPLFCLKYGKYRFENNEKNIDETIIYIVKDNGNIKPSIESDIIFNKNDKTITGWPNRFRVNAYGYFCHSGMCIIPNDNIIGACIFNKELYDLLIKLENEIKDGSLQTTSIADYKANLINVLNDKDIIVIKIMIDINNLAEIMINGLINQTVQSQIRKIILSQYSLDGWKIINNGDHTVPLWQNKSEVGDTINTLRNIINTQMINNDIKQEFKKLQ